MLPFLLIIPLIGTVAIIFAPAKHAKAIALSTSLFAFIFSIVLGFLFDKWGTSQFGLTAEIPWFETFGVSLNMGADSVSMPGISSTSASPTV